MDENPFSGLGLRPVDLADRAVLTSCFASLNEPLSDYTFSQLYTWRNSLKILWRMIRGHLCVFANGTGDLTLLMPPIGDTGSDAALAEAFEVMDAYNARRGVLDRSRVEYVSDELLARLGRANLDAHPMGADYVYDVGRMIDLAGGDLASKRQAKNRFMRNYRYRVEPYVAAQHRDACLALLDQWKIHQDAQHLEESNANAVKRSKESIATALCLDTAEELGLKGLVVYVDGSVPAENQGFRGQGSGSRSETTCVPVSDPAPGLSLNPEPGTLNPSVRAFTFGEYLGSDQSSITIEKTDLEVKGLAQFVFSEFCRLNWADRPLVNVGDDWGLESLAWTKQSYRPVKLLHKYVLRKVPAVVSGPSFATPAAAPANVELPAEPARFMPIHEPIIRRARKEDVAAAMAIEASSFTAFGLTRRQLNYHQQRGSSIFLVAEQAEQVVGDGIALLRQHKTGVSGRIYSLVVRDDCRGQRIGSKLLAALLAELGARGVRRVYLEVEASNASAIRLYERHGFRRIGDLPDYYGAGNPGLHMMHELPAAQPAAA
jgi:ribosomal protein S18 acetylase RimI-like enzyme